MIEFSIEWWGVHESIASEMQVEVKVMSEPRVQPSLQLQSERGMFRLLLLVSLLLLVTSARDTEHHVMLHHRTQLEPERDKYIWNPFPASCGPNATAVRCGGVCPETCDYKSSRCTGHCGVPCVCRPGYVFNVQLLKCIRRSDCTGGQQQQVAMHRVFQ